MSLWRRKYSDQKRQRHDGWKCISHLPIKGCDHKNAERERDQKRQESRRQENNSPSKYEVCERGSHDPERDQQARRLSNHNDEKGQQGATVEICGNATEGRCLTVLEGTSSPMGQIESSRRRSTTKCN